MENSQAPELLPINQQRFIPYDSYFNYGSYANNNELGGVGGGDHDGGELIHNDKAADATQEDQEKEHYYIHGIKEEEYFGSLPSGFRFEPHDHELILDYLKKRINDEKLPHSLIKLVNLYEQGPYDLTARYPRLGENRWYFFTPRDRKYQNGSRPNRAAGNGYWKATGKDKSIKLHGRDGPVIGFRKVLVFYDGRPKDGEKTNWTMHEYRVNEASKRVRTSMTDMRLDDYVLCKLIWKPEKTNKNTRRGVSCKISKETENTYNQTLTLGGRGGDGGGDQTTSISNDGAGTSSNNNSEDNYQMHPINNGDHDQLMEVNSSKQHMINYSPNEFQITSLPPMCYYYLPSTYQLPPQQQMMTNDEEGRSNDAAAAYHPAMKMERRTNDVEGTSMANVAAAPYNQAMKEKSRENPQYMLNHINYDTKWEIDNLNKAMDMPFPELENMLHLDNDDSYY